MATFSVDGLGDFMLSMQQVAELPGEVIDEILEAGSEVVIKAQKDELLTLGLYDNESSGPHLVDSIKLHKKTPRSVRRWPEPLCPDLSHRQARPI